MAKIGSIRVLIVEDHPVFSVGLAAIIKKIPQYYVIGEAANNSDALIIAEREKPQLVTIDINLGEDSGLDLIPQLKSIDQEVVILVLSSYDERYYSERLLSLGARGYIMKKESVNNVIEAIKTVMSGKVYLSENERDRIFQAMTGENSTGIKDWTMSLHKLSGRELQVFTLIGKGLGTIEIASKFKLSTKTIDTHKEHIKLKLHCSTSQELRQMAIEWSNHNQGN
jgi:DNA-binding NarL/FixJ family response regulator